MQFRIQDIEESRPFTLTNIPAGWNHNGIFGRSAVYINKINSMTVLISLDRINPDEFNTLHVSVSRKNKLPTWDDLKKVKHDFIGAEGEAFQCFPKNSEFVNMHSYCMHLWSTLWTVKGSAMIKTRDGYIYEY